MPPSQHQQLQIQREIKNKKMTEEASFSEPELTIPSNSGQDHFQNSRKKRSDNTKRFSDEQVKSLESMFHKGAKLEPRNKLQLAKDLGLQPRQVSIWFQNKRARWKSKKMEQEYTSLQASYDSLYQQYGCLKKENNSLREQLDRVKSRLENSTCNQSSSKDSNENAMNTNEAVPNSEHEESHERGINSNAGMEITTYIYCRDQEQEQELEQELEQEPESFTFSDQEDSWKESRRQWFVPNGILDDPSCPSNWWDF